MHFRHRGKKFRIETKDSAIPIISLDEGERGIIAHAIGGSGLLRRLAEMGLTPGAEVKILRKCPFRGPVEIEVRGVMLALGYGVALKVYVKPVKEEVDG